MSPTTGRIIVAAVGILSLAEAYVFASPLFYVVATLGAIGLFQAVFNPKIFGDG